MNEFYQLYDELRQQYPLYLVLGHLRNNDRWRIEIYAKGMSKRGEDASIMTVEANERQQLFKEATVRLEKARQQLKNLAS